MDINPKIDWEGMKQAYGRELARREDPWSRKDKVENVRRRAWQAAHAVRRNLHLAAYILESPEYLENKLDKGLFFNRAAKSVAYKTALFLKKIRK
jgi:hypothetical protein